MYTQRFLFFTSGLLSKKMIDTIKIDLFFINIHHSTKLLHNLYIFFEPNRSSSHDLRVQNLVNNQRF